MAIRKAKQKKNYTIIPNAPLRDKSLSWKSKGLLSFLLSMDDDWVIHKRDLANRSSDGYDATSSSFNELVSSGYIIDRGRQRRSDGLFGDNLYEVYDSPQKTDKPSKDNPELDSTRIRSTTITFSNNSTNSNKKSLISNTESEDSAITDKITDSKNKPTDLYKSMIDFWLKEFHIGWTFSAVHGKKIKSLITKFKKVIKDYGKSPTDDVVLDLFKKMCLSLPEYYKEKDLPVIDSKFNEIITEIKNSKNGKSIKSKQSVARNAREAFSRFE